MSYADRLTAEINAVLDELADEGSEWRAAWIAHQICERHAPGLGDGEDADFWRHCGYADCRREVTRCINRRAGDRPESDPGQLTLPGYEHLHAYYVVDRDGQEVGVPVHDMTAPELESKVRHYRKMGAACFAHANEIERYMESRASA